MLHLIQYTVSLFHDMNTYCPCIKGLILLKLHDTDHTMHTGAHLRTCTHRHTHKCICTRSSKLHESSS